MLFVICQSTMIRSCPPGHIQQWNIKYDSINRIVAWQQTEICEIHTLMVLALWFIQLHRVLTALPLGLLATALADLRFSAVVGCYCTVHALAATCCLINFSSWYPGSVPLGGTLRPAAEPPTHWLRRQILETWLEISRLDRAHMISYPSIVGLTMALSCIVSHMLPDIGRKLRNLYYATCIQRPV